MKQIRFLVTFALQLRAARNGNPNRAVATTREAFDAAYEESA